MMFAAADVSVDLCFVFVCIYIYGDRLLRGYTIAMP